MAGSRTMVLAAAVVALAGVSAVEAGPFRDGSNSRPIFGGRIFNGRFFRPFQKQPTPTQPAGPIATEEPPLAAAPTLAAPAPAPATASAPLPVGPAAPAKVIESPRTALPVGPPPGVDTSLPPSR